MNTNTLGYLRPFLTVILFISFLFSCNHQPAAEESKGVPDEVEALKQEVMLVHDKIMPKIDTLMKLKRQLKERVSQIDTMNSVNKKKVDAILSSVEQLEEADEAMMQWMRTYQDPDQKMGKAEALQYLERKKKEILEVKAKMLAGQEAATSMLKTQ
jgi:hypothetical protein